MKIYQLEGGDEPHGQRTLGLFATVELARAAVPGYLEELKNIFGRVDRPMREVRRNWWFDGHYSFRIVRWKLTE